MLKLYEFLIPTHFNNGELISKPHHEEFYDILLSWSDGLTISEPINGMWKKDDKIYKEKVMFIRCTCSDIDANMIAILIKDHYQQISVMYYPISKKVKYYE